MTVATNLFKPESGYTPSHPFRRPADLSHFYVVTVINNPMRYDRRYELYHKFADMVKAAGVQLVTVEQVSRQDQFMVTDASNPWHVQIRTDEIMWFKENMINVAVAKIIHNDPEANKIAWVDADCMPMTPAREWFEETWHELEQFEFVQMWEHLINFGPQGQPIGKPDLSFMATYAKAGFEVPANRQIMNGDSGVITFGRTGLAWAANVSALHKVGGLLSCCILGSGDWHMAWALVGAMTPASEEFKGNSRYMEKIYQWQERAERWIKRDVGFVRMTVGHWWHGNKVHRFYGSRGKILSDLGFDPDKDLKMGANGLYQLETWEPRQIKLRDQVRNYFDIRNEDSVDLL